MGEEREGRIDWREGMRECHRPPSAGEMIGDEKTREERDAWLKGTMREQGLGGKRQGRGKDDDGRLAPCSATTIITLAPSD